MRVPHPAQGDQSYCGRVVAMVATMLVVASVMLAAPAVEAKPPTRDSDHDRMPDRWEKRNGLNPSRKADKRRDPDADRVVNIAEYRSRCLPGRADTDNDGIGDFDERRFSFP